jgi:hypothetical protein
MICAAIPGAKLGDLSARQSRFQAKSRRAKNIEVPRTDSLVSNGNQLARAGLQKRFTAISPEPDEA